MLNTESLLVFDSIADFYGDSMEILHQRHGKPKTQEEPCISRRLLFFIHQHLVVGNEKLCSHKSK